MSLVSLRNVHLEYDAQIVLHDLDWEIQRGEKIGLIGPNGAGKTSIFKLITGDVAPQIGTVTRTRGLQVGYLPQEPQLETGNTLLAEVTTCFEHLRELEQRVADVAHEISEHHETDRVQELMEEYDELQARLHAAGGYDYEVLVKEVLGGLGFSPADYELPIANLSGGQKCRAALAQLLLQEADLLLLDEPTNHLDIEASRFLERFLAGYHGAAIIISHDRYLLDRVVAKIADLESRKISVYPCAYSDYVEAKEVRQLTQLREYEKQQDWLTHQRDFIARNHAAKDTAARAHAREKMVQRVIDDGRLVDKPSITKRRIALKLEAPGRVADRVLLAENLRKAYGDKVLFDGLNFQIRRGEKVGIIGPNGVGKTTLLKMAVRQVEPDAGSIQLAPRASIGYYDQEHAGLNPEHRVIDEIDPDPGARSGEIRSFLARFLFQGDDVFKRVGDLSGGEQSRVSLAKLVWSDPQVLILDEPTNHLDIPSKEVLEETLIDFEGAVLLVSHDRYFLNRVVNRLLVLPERGKYEVLVGNWTTYEERLAQREAEQRAAADEARRQQRRPGKPRGRRDRGGGAQGLALSGSPCARWSLERLEEEIIEREGKLAEVEFQFANPEVFRDAGRLQACKAQAQALRDELTALNTEWESRAAEEA